MTISNGFRIQLATLHDLYDIHHIDQKAFRPWGDHWSKTVLIDQLSRRETVTYVAREGFGDERTVGFLVAEDGGVLKVATILPRRGVGRGLVVASGCSSAMIRHANVASIRLFTSLGFELTEGQLRKMEARTWGWWVRPTLQTPEHSRLPEPEPESRL